MILRLEKNQHYFKISKNILVYNIIIVNNIFICYLEVNIHLREGLSNPDSYVVWWCGCNTSDTSGCVVSSHKKLSDN